MLHGRSTGSLDDIMLEDDTDLHKELDDFFGPESEVSEQIYQYIVRLRRFFICSLKTTVRKMIIKSGFQFRVENNLHYFALVYLNFAR